MGFGRRHAYQKQPIAGESIQSRTQVRAAEQNSSGQTHERARMFNSLFPAAKCDWAIPEFNLGLHEVLYGKIFREGKRDLLAPMEFIYPGKCSTLGFRV